VTDDLRQSQRRWTENVSALRAQEGRTCDFAGEGISNHPAENESAARAARAVPPTSCTCRAIRIGRRNADADVLAASAAFERLRPWRDSYRLCRERPLSVQAKRE
jgi:hypothetical protein